jgi:hypothetical protein
MRKSTRRLLPGGRTAEEWEALHPVGRTDALLAHLYTAAESFLRLQVPGDEDESPDQPDDDDPNKEPGDEKNDKKRKDKKDSDDPEDPEGDDEAAAREAYNSRAAVARRMVHLACKARNEPEPAEFIEGPRPFRTVVATAEMFDAARAKLTPISPAVDAKIRAAGIARALDNPDPTRRMAAQILAAGEKARSDPPLPDKVNSAALFMIERSQQRMEAERQFKKNGFVRP